MLFYCSPLLYTFKFKHNINRNKCALNKWVQCYKKLENLRFAKIQFRVLKIFKQHFYIVARTLLCRRWWCALFFPSNVISRIFAMKIYYHRINEKKTNEKELVSTTFSCLSPSLHNVNTTGKKKKTCLRKVIFGHLTIQSM